MIRLILCAYLFFFSSFATANPTIIDTFIGGTLNTWEQKSFAGYTHYKITNLGLQATSESSASSIYKEVHIDLEKTPILNWTWRIDKRLDIADETVKQGDDFSARVYVIVKGEWGFWQTKSLIYVWSAHMNKFQSWESPYAGSNVVEIALRTQSDQLKHWYTEKRNVLNDIRKHFGTDIRIIDAVAIMTDTDNTKSSALSYYKNLYFSEN